MAENDHDPLRNPNDPLHDRPELEKELFKSISKLCSDKPTEVVLGAVANIVINAIRQQCHSRKKAEDMFEELNAKTKIILLDHHYDAHGRRRNVFPFHQVIEVPHFDLRSGKVGN